MSQAPTSKGLVSKVFKCAIDGAIILVVLFAIGVFANAVVPGNVYVLYGLQALGVGAVAPKVPTFTAGLMK